MQALQFSNVCLRVLVGDIDDLKSICILFLIQISAICLPLLSPISLR